LLFLAVVAAALLAAVIVAFGEHIEARGLPPAPDLQADAIVVLAAGLRADGRPTAATAARVRAGVALWEAGVAPTIVMTGGTLRAGLPPAGAAMATLAVALGVPAERMILLRPRGRQDAIWAIDQALRSGAVAAVWATVPMRIDDRDARRWQLAAETGRTPGLLVRGFPERRRPGFSEVQFYVAEGPPGLSTRGSSSGQTWETVSVTLDRARGGGMAGQQITLRIDDGATIQTLSSDESRRHETAAVHLAAQLAHPTTAKRNGQRAASDRNRGAVRSA